MFSVLVSLVLFIILLFWSSIRFRRHDNKHLLFSLSSQNFCCCEEKVRKCLVVMAAATVCLSKELMDEMWEVMLRLHGNASSRPSPPAAAASAESWLRPAALRVARTAPPALRSRGKTRPRPPCAGWRGGSRRSRRTAC